MVNLIHDVVDDDHPRAELLKDCQEMLANVSNVAVSYIPRTCNSCAHRLAQSGYNHNRNDVFWVDFIPPGVRDVLLDDKLI